MTTLWIAGTHEQAGRTETFDVGLKDGDVAAVNLSKGLALQLRWDEDNNTLELVVKGPDDPGPFTDEAPKPGPEPRIR